MTAVAVVKKQQSDTSDPEGGDQRQMPWPLISADSCHHLDWYPALVKGEDDDEEYEAEICALCGTVRGLRAAQGGGQDRLEKALTWASPVWRADLQKAGDGYVDWKNDPRYRWITMRPHGEDGEGYPVLIRMDDPSGESGGGTVVGGAGGSMNYRRVSGVKTKGEYRTEARRKRKEAKERRERREKQQEEEAKAEGMTEADLSQAEEERKGTLEEIEEEEELARAEYLATVQDVTGWEGPQVSHEQAQGMTEKSQERIERERARRLVKKADKAADAVRDRVIEKHDQEMAEEIGTKRAEELDSEEVDDSGMGYVAKISALAEENGLSEESARNLSRAETDAALKAAAEGGFMATDEDGNPKPLYGKDAEAAAKGARERIDYLQEKAQEAREEDKLHKEEGAHEPDAPEEAIEDPEKARKLLLAQEKYKQRQRELKAAKREVKKAAPTAVEEVAEVTRGDALVEMGRMTDDEAMERVEESLQARARITAADRLLSRVEDLEGGVESVEQHLLEGRHVQLEEVSQAIFHQPLGMRREVLDLLGPEAGGVLLAHMMTKRLSEEDREAVAEALREEHIETQVQRSRDALATAQEHFDAAQSAMAGFGAVGELGPEGLEAASAAKKEKLQELREARKLLGTTLGKLQMLGALNAALTEGQPRTLDVPLGQVGSRAWQIAAGMGLDQSDYEIQSDGPNKYIKVARDAFDKLIDPPDREQARQYEVAVGIKRGDADEEDWLAEGLMRRPSEKYYEDPDYSEGWGVDPKEILDGQYGAGLTEALREYAGRELANGGVAGAATLRNRMMSALWQAENLDDMQREQFADAVAEVFPAEGADDNWASAAEDLVKPFVEESTQEREALDAQNIDIVSARDPIHRALQAVPEGKVAYTPINQMTAQDKALIRQYFWNNLTDEEPPSAIETREQREAQEAEAEEVVAQQVNMFGEVEEVTRGETEAYQEQQAEEEAEEADHAWNRYVKAMKGVGNAYASVQGLIQGDLAEEFATHYGRETGRGLRTAPVDVPNALKHVVGLMPREALERVLEADNGVLQEMYEGLRKRDQQGRYAPGAVSDLAQRILEKAKKMQLTLFGDEAPAAQRLSIGSTAEKQLKKAWQQVAEHFDPDRPASIVENLSQSGRYVHQQRSIKMLERVKRMGLHHSTGCIAGDTVIVDPHNGEGKTVREHYEQRTHPRVLALGPDGRLHTMTADIPFVKGRARLQHVTLANGSHVSVAPHHQFLTPTGWKTLEQIVPGDLVAVAGAASRDRSNQPVFGKQTERPRPVHRYRAAGDHLGLSTPLGARCQHLPVASAWPYECEHARPQTIPVSGLSVRPEDAPRLMSRRAGCRARYSDDHRPHDELLHHHGGDAPNARTSRGDAREFCHSVVSLDGPGDEEEHTHPGRYAAPHSTPDFAHQEVRDHVKECHTSQVGAGLRLHCSPVRRLSQFASSARRRTFAEESLHPGDTVAACLSLGECPESVTHATPVSCSTPKSRPLSPPICAHATDQRLSDHQRSRQSAPVETCPQPVTCSIPHWVPVSTIEVGESEDYFDLEVPVYHNYVAHGIVHHNSGKSLSAIGGFTHLKSKGEVDRGLFIVPPKIQAQFGGEVNAYAEPGRFDHFSDPSADREERHAAYADPGRDMVVVSHQAWRDDVTWAVAQQRFGGEEEAASDWLQEADREEAKQAVQEAVDAQGWSFDFNMVDEGHDTLNRRGKPDSRMARTIDGTTDRAEYFITATATPVKNDASEVYDLLRKVRPDKFPADGYEDFRRKYALDTEANREAMQRLVAPYFYAKSVDTGVEERHYQTAVDVSDYQRDQYREVLENYNAARNAEEGSDERREAIANLVPDEHLEGMSEEGRAQKLDDLGQSLGFTRDRAIARVLEHAPPEHNPRIQQVVELARRHEGKDADGGQVPGLVFAQSLDSVKLIADELEKQGFRVGVVTGELSGNDTELRRMQFNADNGRGEGEDLAQEAARRREMAEYDILVGSGAAGTGLNLERARWLVHYDQPWTAKEIAQRNGRQNRLNQHWGEVEIHTLGVDVPYDQRRRELVERKRGLMTTFMEPTEQIDDGGLARRVRESRAERLTEATEDIYGVSGGGRSSGGGMQEAAT